VSTEDGRGGFARPAPRTTLSMQQALDFLSRRGHWVAAPAGAALALAFAPLRLVPLAVLCPALLFLLWHGAPPRSAAWRGFLFTGATFLAGTYWLYHSIHLVGGAPLWIAAFLMLGLVAIMGAYTAGLGYAIARWGAPAGTRRWLLLLPAGWVLVEWFRGWFLSGFPWLALGYTQLDTPLAGLAPLAGVYGTSLGVALVAGALVTLLLGSRTERVVAASLAAAVVLAALGLGRLEWTEPRGPGVEVALVQGAVPQSMKWQPGQRERTMQLYAGLTEPHLGRAGIVVWPEVALPGLDRDLRGFLEDLHASARARGTDVVTGLLRRDPSTGAYYNAMAAFGATEQWYYKRRLFEPGPREQAPLSAAGETLAPTICYEDAYAVEQLSLARRSTLLVNVTNDAWFGDSTAPHQHLDISRMRSLETGRPMLRATNDGVTALIAYDGRLLGRLPQFEPGVLTGVVEPRTGDTPYARLGNAPVLALLALGLAAGLRRPATRGARRR